MTTGRNHSLPGAYAHTLGKAAAFVGKHFATTLMTAISFAIIYKFILSKDK